jgi:predicted RNA-binding protein (virulence factor B family)
MKPEKKQYEHFVESGVFQPWDEVEVEILAYTEMGIKVAIEDEYIGLAYKNEIYQDYDKGQKVTAYIKAIRDDGKIDISFQPYQGKHVRWTKDVILAHLAENGGKSEFNDKSSPVDIRRVFQMSKKVFKQSIGNLYKLGKIKITDEGIELV